MVLAAMRDTRPLCLSPHAPPTAAALPFDRRRFVSLASLGSGRISRESRQRGVVCVRQAQDGLGLNAADEPWKPRGGGTQVRRVINKKREAVRVKDGGRARGVCWRCDGRRSLDPPLPRQDGTGMVMVAAMVRLMVLARRSHRRPKHY